MRTLHAPVWQGFLTALSDIFGQGVPADKVIQRQLKLNRKWGSHDRRLFAEGLYDIVRWWRRLLFVSGVNWPSTDRFEIADEKAFVAVIQAWCHLHEVELGKNLPRRSMSEVESLWRDNQLPRAILQSVPDWLDRWGDSQLGELWPEKLAVLNSSAPVYLRANTLKVSAAQLVHRLGDEKISAELIQDDCVRLVQRGNLFLTSSFRAGLFELQDVHSQAVVKALDPQPGERVIDACAGGGGKSLHAAARMGNKGRVLAMDVVDRKLIQLRERAKRSGASCIETRLIESRKTIKRLANSADRLLLDVPCSGLGVLRRNPDAKWRLKPEELDRLQGLQDEILTHYSTMLRPGGRLVYATCSMMPAENERQVEHFLSRSETAFQLEKQQTLGPEKDGGDGFFVAVFEKKK